MKKTIAIAIASIFASSAAFAAAATIGGITTTDLGADTTVVASCDSDGINIDFNTAFDAALGIQEVVSVSVTGIDSDCENQTLDVGLTNSAGSSSVNAVQVTVGSSGSETAVITNGFPAEDVDTVAVVISG